MFDTLLSMVILITCGVGWRYLSPGGVTADQARQVITSVVYYLLLPALVLFVLWRAPLGLSSIKISLLSAVGILTAMLISWLGCRSCRLPNAVTGAVVLAASFPNATYLGLPVLVALFGDWASSVAIQYDLFASTPLLFTVGILLAQYFGRDADSLSIISRLLHIPAMWAALIAILLNITGVPFPGLLQQTLSLLGESVIPLMLLALGMSLRWDALHWHRLPSVAVVVVIQLILMPLIVWSMASLLYLDSHLVAPVVLEGAMPSMVIGIVICDRYKLDTGIYAAAVTITTLLSLISLPLWFNWLT